MYHDGPKKKQEVDGISGSIGDKRLFTVFKRHQWGQKNVGQLAILLEKMQGNFVEPERHQNKSFPVANSSRVAAMHGFPK